MLTSVFSWKTAEVEFEEEKEPENVSFVTVSFCVCEWYRTVMLFVGNEMLFPSE